VPTPVLDAVFVKVTVPLDASVVNAAVPGVPLPILKLFKEPTVPDDKFTALVLPARLTLKFEAAPPLADILKLPLTAILCIANGGTTPPGPAAVSTVPINFP
jgi:hypothetical protein